MKLTPWQRFRTRLYLAGIGMVRRITLGVRGVLLDGDRVLLIRQTYLPGWHMPGGGVEPGETAETSAAREILEETGYAVAGRPVLHGLFLNRWEGTNRDHVAVYVWRDFRVQRAFTPNMEVAELRWFAVDALPEDIEPGTRLRIAEITGGRPAPTEWLG
jgi:ADP-ribose pyrophosphatase YjhB (NUDIX family)